MDYRREIDGLRAVAVIPVILFHAGFQWFSGGYVGVDVFFVISGYLITAIIISELAQGDFSLVQFYQRRARRILPALFFVMACCIPFALMWMLPIQLNDFSESLIAVTLFASNVLFWRESGYFAPAAGELPLLHTWSLAVEEQYYILFPIFLILIWRFGRTPVFYAIVLVAAVSLLLSQWGSRNAPIANFFLAPTRVWELLAGSLCAFVAISPGLTIRNLASILGLGMVVFGVVFFDQSTPFPSFYALVPVVGTALILLFGTRGTITATFLSARGLVGIGLISYSAYLWHQPLFAFARIRSLHAPTQSVMIGAAVLSIVLAYFSWRFVETPFRRKRAHTRLYSVSAMVAAGFVGLGLLSLQFDLPGRLPLAPNIEYQSFGEKLADVGNVCELAGSDDYPGVRFCFFGDLSATRTVALYGDSHARAISHNLGDQLVAKQIKGIFVEASGCEIVPTIVVEQFYVGETCGGNFDALLNFVSNTADAIVVVSRWTLQLYPIENRIEFMTFDNQEGGVEVGDLKEFAVVDENGGLDRGEVAKRGALTGLVWSLLTMEMPIFLTYPIPEVGWDIAKENIHSYKYQSKILDRLSTDMALYDRRNAFVIETFDAITDPDLIPVRPRDIFCNTLIQDRCVAQFDGVPLYYDDDHLSYVGAEMLVNQIFQNLDLE
ncbi:MAG: acyltransferase [Alphaproteobacteria bacterium]|jgi:peptidoglycan/LPS O-acetylase OafA/YrhL|nr:acyltransferase [Alphaproteobacteria bacterium]MBT5860481.1 acyltransferase [Alphaproteobacteria bacterium]